MRKVCFNFVLSGLAWALACSTSPQMSWAGDGEAPIQLGSAAKAAVPRHSRHLAAHMRNKRAETKRSPAAMTAAAMPRQAIALANAPTQADIAAAVAMAHSGDAREGAAAAKTDTGRASESKAVSEDAVPRPPAPVPHEVRQFCANTATAATDARIAWQAARLTELATKLRQRIAELEAKRAEYEDWLHRHDDAMKEAKEDVAAIYSRMRPDAAAAQLAAMDEVMAASLLTKLNSRVASAILAEMDPGRAARIANAMAGPVGATGGKKS